MTKGIALKRCLFYMRTRCAVSLIAGCQISLAERSVETSAGEQKGVANDRGVCYNIRYGRLWLWHTEKPGKE